MLAYHHKIKLFVFALSTQLAFIAPARADHETTSLQDKIAHMEEGLRPAYRMKGEPGQRWTLEERMDHYNVPGVSIALIQDGNVVWAKGYGTSEVGSDNPIDPDTVFSVGSLSKTAGAMVALKMVADKELDLDHDVNEYLTTWQLPESDFSKTSPATLRGLFAHTAGLSVSGFADYLPGEDLPTTIETLNGMGPAKNDPVEFIYTPGTHSSYSGGGTTVAELVMEDVSALSFPEVSDQKVFTPLRMTRTTFENPLPASHGNIAHAHDENGERTALPRGWHAFPERAASGLWTTPTDYATMLIALVDSYHGEEDAFLPQALAIDTLTEQGPSDHGIAPVMKGSGIERRLAHGGSNEAYKALYEVFLETQSGIVVFTNGANGWPLNDEIARATYDAFGWPGREEIISIPTSLSSKQLGKFAGIYELTTENLTTTKRLYRHGTSEIEILLRKGKLHINHEGHRGDLLLPLSSHRYITEDGFYEIEFVKSLTGGPMTAVIRGGDNMAEVVRTQN
ncbi:MAG: serine hydrolase domain-containing protein [Pseudomonadota bacterium]